MVVPVHFVSVAAGVLHSCAIDASGTLYTWGGGGGAMLGLGERSHTTKAIVTDAMRQRALTQAGAGGLVAKGKRVGRKRPWLRPRRVVALTNQSAKVVQVSTPPPCGCVCVRPACVCLRSVVTGVCWSCAHHCPYRRG